MLIAPYLPAGPERDLLTNGDFKVDTTRYDWILSSRANARR